MRLSGYETFVFDCDGVILDSNRIKTEAFSFAGMSYGREASESLVKYHIDHGGVSRYAKFRYFLDYIVPEYCPEKEGPGYDELVATFSTYVRNGLETCRVSDGLKQLRWKTRNSTWLIVSGGDQEELRDVFTLRGLDSLFDGGIFGSPDTKKNILKRELEAGTIRKPALFLGDSRLDYVAAANAGLDFIFVNGWTEVKNWRSFIREVNCSSINSVETMLSWEDRLENAT